MAKTFLKVFRMLATLVRFRMFLERFENISVLFRAKKSRLCTLTDNERQRPQKWKAKVVSQGSMEDLASCTSSDAVLAVKKPKALPRLKDDVALDNRVQHAAKDPRQRKFSKVSVSNIILSTLLIENYCKSYEVSKMF